MKQIAVYIGIILLIGLYSFKETTSNTLEEKLLGTWVYKEKVKGLVKATTFDANEGGFKFLSDGKLITRGNVGSCGTPPISYKNYNGNWSVSKDSILKMEYKFWGGTALETVKIIQLTETSLVNFNLELEVINKDGKRKRQ